VGSVLSIGSAGSVLSIGSAGSILSIGSAGSILSIGSAGAVLGIDADGDRSPEGGEAEGTRASSLVSGSATILAVAAVVAGFLRR
jgi:hypothetical protein